MLRTATILALGVPAAMAVGETCLSTSTKEKSGPEGNDFTTCVPWKSNSCCSHEKAAEITDPAAYEPCGEEGLSLACEQALMNERCFAHCDPSLKVFETEGVLVPVRADYCNSVLLACADDYLFYDSGKFSHQQESDASECKKVSDVATNGKEMCEALGDSFISYTYEEDLSQGKTMFFVGSNPNLALEPQPVCEASPDAPNPFVKVGDKCVIQNAHTKAVSGPEEKAFPECHPWNKNACCSTEIAETIRGDELYGDAYKWDLCGKLSPECERMFIAESCFYECDVNTGFYQRYENDPDNMWELFKMPINGAFCDAWYDACRNDHFCFSTTGNYFDTCDDKATQCKPISEIYNDGKDLCERMWGDAFAYEEDATKSYTMWFTTEDNPNDKVSQCLHYEAQDTSPHAGQDNDACLQAHESWGVGYKCSENESYCPENEASSYQEMGECCQHTCKTIFKKAMRAAQAAYCTTMQCCDDDEGLSGHSNWGSSYKCAEETSYCTSEAYPEMKDFCCWSCLDKEKQESLAQAIVDGGDDNSAGHDDDHEGHDHGEEDDNEGQEKGEQDDERDISAPVSGAMAPPVLSFAVGVSAASFALAL